MHGTSPGMGPWVDTTEAEAKALLVCSPCLGFIQEPPSLKEAMTRKVRVWLAAYCSSCLALTVV